MWLGPRLNEPSIYIKNCFDIDAKLTFDSGRSKHWIEATVARCHKTIHAFARFAMGVGNGIGLALCFTGGGLDLWWEVGRTCESNR